MVRDLLLGLPGSIDSELCVALPSLHPGFGEHHSLSVIPLSINPASLAIPTILDGGNHTPGFEKSAATIESHYACLDVSKALAATGVRVLLDDAFFANVCAGTGSYLFDTDR